MKGDTPVAIGAVAAAAPNRVEAIAGCADAIEVEDPRAKGFKGGAVVAGSDSTFGLKGLKLGCSGASNSNGAPKPN